MPLPWRPPHRMNGLPWADCYETWNPWDNELTKNHMLSHNRVPCAMVALVLTTIAVWTKGPDNLTPKKHMQALHTVGT